MLKSLSGLESRVFGLLTLGGLRRRRLRGASNASPIGGPMDRSIRRYLALAAILSFVALLAAGSISSTSAPSPAHSALAATSDANASFDPFDTKTPSSAPPALIAGQPSHQGTIPTIVNGTNMNAYCVTVTNPAAVSSPAFRVSGSGKKVTTVTDAQRNADALATRIIVQSPRLTNPAGDVKYCVQIRAAVGWTKTTLTWTYNSGVSSISVDIQTANITLDPTDGTAFPGKELPGTPLGRPAELCSEGWNGGIGPTDPLDTASSNAFLTGRLAFPPGNTTPDKVIDANWVLGSSTPGVTFAAKSTVNQRARTLIDGQAIAADYKEQCVIVSATATAAPPAFPWNAPYTFDFSSIYQPWLVVTPPVAEVVKFVQGVPELFFPNDPGANVSPKLVTYAPMTVCISGTNQADIISAGGISFVTLGGPDTPNVTNLSISNGQPRCVTWTSSSPGEQTLSAAFTWLPDTMCPVTFPTNPCVPGSLPPVQVIANWDSDHDGNGCHHCVVGGTILVIQWNRIDFTRLTTGGDPEKNIVTNTNITRPVNFNIADGSFVFSMSITEWVFGSHNSVGYRQTGVVDGARIRAKVTGACGYFDVPALTAPTTIEGVSVGGRIALDVLYDSPANLIADDIKLTILNDKNCNINSTVSISVDVFYPNQIGSQAVPALSPPETLSVTFTFVTGQKVPQFAWAGQTVTITYAVSAGSGGCGNASIRFVRGHGQPGTFLPGSGLTLNGPDQVVAGFGSCSASVLYESEDPGEVDIEAFIVPGSGPLLQDSGPFSKIAIPIYFMLLEDVTITATPTTVVSEPGDVSAKVRGFFVGTNPSGRLAEKKPDGRTTPADRWVMPDDYEKLRGPVDFRPNWPGSAPMPPARVTFLMQNEGVRNSYTPAVKTGAVGWFLPDDATDILFNINPLTNQPSVLGTEARPRIMSEFSDTSGNASVDTFGDFNLSYEACAKSPINGNPLCKPDDVVGHTRYFVIADYPFTSTQPAPTTPTPTATPTGTPPTGTPTPTSTSTSTPQPPTGGQNQPTKFPPIISNVAETEWTWFGYKSVTVVNTENPQIKYVVAHLRDRDGFCDAYQFNNVLGVKVRFEIDAGDGTIIDAADRPYTISGNRRFAEVTTFDIRNDLNQPMNTDIAKTSVSDDECQAWIRVTNSLLQPTNVIVTFPPPPSPVPGNVRITGLTCTGLEQITVTNQGTKPVSLAGFSFRSPPQAFGPFEYFGLDGHLDPGQSVAFTGGPAAPKLGWLFSGDEIFTGGGDYASLVWDGFEIDRIYCDGRPAIHNTIPASFLPDGEGEIVIDITIPFGIEKAVDLVSGWNLLTAGSVDTVIKDALAGKESSVNGIYLWDETKLQWGHYIPSAPESVNTISKFEKGKIYWVQVNQPFTLLLLK